MNYLFEVRDKKPERKAVEPEKPIAPRDEAAGQAPAVLGKADDLFDCWWCQSRCHDVIDEYKGRWKVECCFCGSIQAVDRVEGVLPELFTFPSGRFAGQSIESVAATDRGLKFVVWAAEKHDNKEVRDACKFFLDSHKPTV